MIVEDLLPRLEVVRRTSRGFQARCPAHPDKNPSLSVSEGERGILLKCWSGCTLREICESLGVEQRDLFWGALDLDPLRRRKAAQQRDRQRHIRERIAHQQGTLIDALREADFFVRSRRGVDISTWTDARLNDELNSLADAYCLLESEDLHER